ncbi:Nif3-like dinuclear metal center hexameric protein [Lutispora sp.]|uniref:Nif3-like dinuclear metal center hexameric protein n=1 Tax=Lutispora sp. TaxID=2828727 RepID=UPI002B219E8D|nr:Nif3-like dinuclear metal center hexameric protein [Lutispora sp.]MEA4960315.1 Nif3-like dinuclear metal center hexameric protein [Lutispora sp.]
MAQLKCGTVASLMDTIAPKKLAEDWDNVGLIVGDGSSSVNKIMISLDLPVWVVEEAIENNVDMIVTHHPLIFSPLKKINTDSAIGEKIIKLIKNNISVYSSHTNFDISEGGLNDIFAKQLGFEKTEVMKPISEEKLYKIVVFVPEGFEDKVMEQMSVAGAGHIGKYSSCSFRVRGIGTFKPGEEADPFIGEIGKLERVGEYRVETVVPEAIINNVVKSMLKAHPYEEVAYDVFEMKNKGKTYGLGRIGQLENSVTLASYAAFVKRTLDIESIRYSGSPDTKIKKVALLNGSGNSFVRSAKFSGADVLITGDMQYHQLVEALEEGICVIDAGHFGTEKIMIKTVSDYLKSALASNGYTVNIIEAKSNVDIIMNL